MSIGLFSHNSVGDSLTQYPKWEDTDTYQIRLSGISLETTLPGNYSQEFESILPENKNLYDKSLYENWPSFILMDLHWKYAARKILWQETLGTLQALAVVHRSPEELKSQNAHSNEFKNIIINNLRQSFEIEDGEVTANSGISMPETYEPIDINNTSWLKYTVNGGTSNADMLSYSTPLTSGHFITIMFRIVGHEGYDVKNWRNKCLDDIERIMDSLKISHPEDNN